MWQNNRSLQTYSHSHGTDGPRPIVRVTAPLDLDKSTLLRMFSLCARPIGFRREPVSDPPAEMNGIQWSYATLKYGTLEDAERTVQEYNNKWIGRNFVISASLMDTSRNQAAKHTATNGASEEAPDKPQALMLLCVVCGKTASHRCMMCHTYYCGPVCQKKDFLKHEPICEVESRNVNPKPHQQKQQQSPSKMTTHNLSVMSLFKSGDRIPAEVFSEVTESILWLRFKPAVLKDNAAKLLEIYNKKKRHSDSSIDREFENAMGLLESLALHKNTTEGHPLAVLCSLKERNASLKVGTTVCLRFNKKISEYDMWAVEVYNKGDTRLFACGALLQWTFSTRSEPQKIEGGSLVRLASYVLPHAYLTPTKHCDEYEPTSRIFTEHAAKAMPLGELPFVGTHVLCIMLPGKIARRAAVLKVGSSSDILVKLIDTGEEESVCKDHLKVLPASLMKHPQYAIRAELAGYSKDIEFNIVKEFLQKLTSVDLTVSVDSEGKVDLRDASGNSTRAFFEKVKSESQQNKLAGINKRDLLLRRLRE